MFRRYVLITPARNEEAFIGETIDAVCAQDLRPLEWIVVSDGSTDRTDEIVRAAAAKHSWIRLVSLAPRDGHCFAAVVRATEVGLGKLKNVEYDFIGLLDADVRFEPDYFTRVISEFEDCSDLGVAGGMVVDTGCSRDELPRNRMEIPGAVQFFRREWFEALGGLLAIPEGGWDTLTCARARQLGYQTRLLTALVVEHLKPRNVAKGGLWQRNKQLGVRDHALGYHPLFEIVKCTSRWKEHPFLAAALARGVGYLSAEINARPRLIPPELRDFIRKEQTDRLLRLVRLPGKRHSECQCPAISKAPPVLK